MQDAAAALPARLLGDVGGRAVIDLCAAPGGKTAQLAAAGARVIAVELSDRRAQRLRTNLERLELEAQIEVADALDWRPPRPVGHVLLDAPCTATGTIRRHPDIAWHKTPADVTRMATLQRQLLDAAVADAGAGRRSWSTPAARCSRRKAPDVIEQALAAGLPMARLPVEARELDGLPVDLSRMMVTCVPCPATWPSAAGSMASSSARLRRHH